ncbi:hypothetical protein SZ64_02830 [Erythrobacter sp. SG61-1L]|uniref:hypothetical protein n=1 Tax=Erythrobacter sp. SG61-1L TaxID=1603897 RepID=UPI0006C92747|nr:hypothetical protein [Erythrobacter sp. SG61-1L]KPL67123.1 hypothetical protein SZ64_02830 [Erythrobacter sp. SG61-1L]
MLADPATLPRPTRAVTRGRMNTSDRLRAAVQSLACGHARIASHRETSWASITFAGTRHRLELLFEGAQAVEAGEHFIAELPDYEFDIPRQLVADAAIVEVDHALTPEPRLAVSVELLLLEDA